MSPESCAVAPALSREERLALTWSALRLLDDWSLPPETQVELLGLGGAVTARELARCRLGAPLPAEGEVYGRIQLLLRLDQALHQIYPHSALAARLWITTPQARLGQATPLDTLLRGDFKAMLSLVDSLDNRSLY